MRAPSASAEEEQQAGIDIRVTESDTSLSLSASVLLHCGTCHNNLYADVENCTHTTSEKRCLMADQSNMAFDFDDWAGLYLENPEEFEARRQATLMIEMMRGSPEQCAAGRELLHAYEKRVKGCDPQQRMQIAASMMMESTKELNTELMLLKDALQKIEADA